MTAYEECIAKIQADGLAYAAIAARIAADPRANALAKAAAVASPITRDGVAGFHQMMESLMSSKHWRKKRAGCLNVARAAQIKGDHGTARAFLAKAAWCRKSEIFYRAVEAVDAGIAGVDQCIKRIADDPDFNEEGNAA